MTDTTPIWPAPVPRPGQHIRHTFRCPRTDPVEYAAIGEPDSKVVCERCTFCGGTDFVWRLQRAAWQARDNDPEGDTAA